MYYIIALRAKLTERMLEFTHIIDEQDGKIDGIPQVLIYINEIGPWLNIIKTKT